MPLKFDVLVRFENLKNGFVGPHIFPHDLVFKTTLCRWGGILLLFVSRGFVIGLGNGSRISLSEVYAWTGHLDSASTALGPSLSASQIGTEVKAVSLGGYSVVCGPDVLGRVYNSAAIWLQSVLQPKQNSRVSILT